MTAPVTEGLMLDDLLARLERHYQPARHRAELEAVWELERWFDTPRQRASAERICASFAEAGLEAEIVDFAADGRTRYQDWTTHLAWSCADAELRLDGELIADRKQVPCNTVFFSAPLGETSAELVDLDRLAVIDEQTVGGKFLLTADYARSRKPDVARYRPAALISDWVGQTTGADEQTVKWCNAWGDGPEGWYFNADDTPLTGFHISPAVGARLRRRLADGPVELSGFCQSELYEGTAQCVTAVLPGSEPDKEIWVYAHAAEQGAVDNASGVAALIEIARQLKEMIGSGALPRPRCSIRFIITEECLGMAAFATLRPDLRHRALAGVNVDGVADACTHDRPHGVFYGPFSQPTIAWSIAGQLMTQLIETSRGDFYTRCVFQVPSADDMITDPNCGVPGVWVGRGDMLGSGYHSSADTPAVCLADPMRWNLLLIAGTAYALAHLRDMAEYLVESTCDWIERFIMPAQQPRQAELRRWVAGCILRDPVRWGVDPSVVFPAIGGYCPELARPLVDLPDTGPVYRRLTWGTCTFEQAGVDRDPRFGRWDESVISVLFWTDGKRSAEAVRELAEAELGEELRFGIEELYEAGLAAGIVERVK